jgi:cobalamin biosynthesis protein CbiG
MDKKILGITVGVAVIIALSVIVLSLPTSEITTIQKTNEKIGLVINSPKQATTLQDLDTIYSTASSTGIGRSNVYLFWNLVEPVRGEFDWKQSDALMSLNKKIISKLHFTFL